MVPWPGESSGSFHYKILLFPRIALTPALCSQLFPARLTNQIRESKMRIGAVLVIALTVGACTTPSDVSMPLSSVPDKNAKTIVKETSKGFSVDVAYSRYQFVPETGALITLCRSIALSRARDEASNRHRAIETLTDEDVRVSTGRNIINARTACRAFVEAKWK